MKSNIQLRLSQWSSCVCILWYIRQAGIALSVSMIWCQTVMGQENRIVQSYLRFAPVFDTVYVQGDRYVEVALAEQVARVKFRSGECHVFSVSSGQKGVQKGIATPTGIYSVQSKYREAVSKQFNNAKMYWWVGFHYNIGFHGLDGTGYHRFLGKRPSSHGCLRMAKESAKALHGLVLLGTPVIVYDSLPARVLAFTPIAKDSSVSYGYIPAMALSSRTTHIDRVLRERLHNLYQGKHFLKNQIQIVMNGEQLRPGGYALGNATALPAQQRREYFISFDTTPRRDNIKQWERNPIISGKEMVSGVPSERASVPIKQSLLTQ